MTQVSWRRILERAEGGASVVNLRDRAPDRQKSRRAEEYAGATIDLEDQLNHAMKRAAHEGRKRDVSRRPPQWEPIYDKDEIAHTRIQPQRNPLMARRLANKPSKSGRNLLAITMSLAVIGFAVYQIKTQWSANHNNAASAPQMPATKAVAALRDATTSGAAQSQFAGNNVNLRPSLASDDSRGATDRAAFERDVQEAAKLVADGNSGNAEEIATLNRDIENAAKLFSQSYKERDEVNETKTSSRSAAIQQENPVGILADAEQVMLRRGHKLLDQGHVAGARLIFESLAEQNSALGAFALAQTYDVNFIRSRGMTNVEPDDALAEKWYQRAGTLTTQSVHSR